MPGHSATFIESTAEMPTRKVRIAIIGAGIGGLTLSAALGANPHPLNRLEIDIYEAASVITEVGAGLTLWPRVWNTMKAINLEKELLQYAPQAPDDLDHLVFRFVKADQQEGAFFHDTIMKGGSTTFHRADLQKVLQSKLTGRLHLQHRFSCMEERGDEVVIHFENGSSATCDLLVGMDGIKSAVRRSLLLKQNLPNSPSTDPIWSGYIAYRGLVSRDVLGQNFPGHRTLSSPMSYVGKGKHIIAYAISRSLINVAAFVADPAKKGTLYQEEHLSSEQIHEELIKAFSEWEPEVQVLLRSLNHPLKWPIYQLVPLKNYASGRVLVGGDAAHGMPPHQGAGASQAIEVHSKILDLIYSLLIILYSQDAYILGALLSSESASLQSALKISDIYDCLRCPAANRVLNASIAMGDLLELNFPGLEKFKEGDANMNMEILKEIGKKVDEELSWTWKESIEEDKARALEMLKSYIDGNSIA